MLQMITTGLLTGALLGFVLQRGRFCLTGGFRDMFIAKDNRIFTALLIAISIQSIGVYALISFGLVQFNPGTFSWLATAFGSFLFGIGIVLAGGCATGTWYRAAEGLIGSWIALFTYMVASAVMRSSLFTGFNKEIKAFQLPNNSIGDTFGLPVWPFVGLLVVVTLLFVARELRKPKLAVATLPARKTGIAHVLFEKRWHPFVTASLIGVIAMLAWPLSEATGRMAGLGITTPTANILQFLVTGDYAFVNWGIFLVLGIFLGSYFAARGSREYRLRSADVPTTVRSFGGGLLMGFGATLAGGCTIGNSLVMTAMMTWQGWTALLFTIIGVWTASYFLFVRRPIKPALAAQTI